MTKWLVILIGLLVGACLLWGAQVLAYAAALLFGAVLLGCAVAGALYLGLFKVVFGTRKA